MLDFQFVFKVCCDRVHLYVKQLVPRGSCCTPAVPPQLGTQPRQRQVRRHLPLLLCRVSASLGSTLLVATMVARTVLPVTVRYLAKHASEELYQLIVIAFCLVAGGITGHMVCPRSGIGGFYVCSDGQVGE